MADYISREAAIDAVDVGNLHRGIINALQAIISDIPSADVVEVVRCKDCKEFQANHHWCGFLKTDIDPDGFCSYGERRSDKNAG